MNTFEIIILGISVLYFTNILWLIIGNLKFKPFLSKANRPKTTFTILIPFRNEALNLPNIIETVYELDYPNHLFEVIFIDDNSEDNSIEIIENLLPKSAIDYSILKSATYNLSSKKSALTLGVKNAKHDWILTTDADCFLPEKWLQSFNNFILKHQPEMIVAPVSYIANSTFLEQFQLLDFFSLQSATKAGFGNQKPFLCNGANLAYKKQLFLDLNGFNDNLNIASGDDIFLMQKALNNNKKVVYFNSENALVYTIPVNSFKALFHQRVRWASKSSHYINWLPKVIGLIVFTMNFLVAFLFISIFLKLVSFNIFATVLLLKIIVDYILINQFCKAFNQSFCLHKYLLSSLLYPFYSTIIALYAFFFKYQWKGRKHSK